MLIWLDAHLSPVVATWLRERWSVDAVAVRDLGLRDASASDIFAAARAARAVVLTKDADFAAMCRTACDSCPDALAGLSRTVAHIVSRLRLGRASAFIHAPHEQTTNTNRCRDSC